MASGFAAQTVQPTQLYSQFLADRQYDQTDEAALGLKLLEPIQTKTLIGHSFEWSVQLPYFDVDGKPTGFNRVRLLMPKTKMKYSQARASGSHIYFSPKTQWRKVMNDVSVDLIITEGEFKAWAITKEILKGEMNYACLGLAGVDSWVDKKGLQLHTDLMQFKWQTKTQLSTRRRRVFIIFDYDGAKSDGEPNEHVAYAETKFAMTLKGLGADVHLCRVGKFAPSEGEKYAIDDHFLAGGNLTQVLTAVSVVLSNVDDLTVRLHEFSTKYAFINGDVIRLKDGLVFGYSKAKIDSARDFFLIPMRNGAMREVALLDEYKKWPKRCDVQKIGIFPEYQGLMLTPDACYNHLGMWAHEPMAGDPSLYIEFCDYFFRDDPIMIEYWHNWIANIIQRPWMKNHTTPQFVSEAQGIGKSAIAEFIAEMMGFRDGQPACITGPGQAFERFNGELKDKIFVVVNEPSSDKDDHSAALKDLITGQRLMIDNKYGAKYSMDNHLNFVFTSNKPYITKMDNASRREAIYKPRTLTPEETYKRVTALMNWARKENGFSIVLNWYYDRDITNFDPKAPAPETAYKQKAVDASKSPIRLFAQELNDWVIDNLNGVAAFTPAQLEVLCERWGFGARQSCKYIRDALMAHGEVDGRKSIKVAGKVVKHTVFVAKTGNQQQVVNCHFAEIAEDTTRAFNVEIG